MIIKCFRCGKDIDKPGLVSVREGNKTRQYFNADYIIAEDTIVNEPRTVYIAVKDNEATLKKKGKGEPVSKEEYDRIEVSTVPEAVGAISIEQEVKIKPIQKTGVICPDCYRSTDFVIWGVHKE